jgi:hypothetical protein
MFEEKKVTPVAPRHDPTRPKNKWCGPAAISILTGITAEEAADRIYAYRAKPTDVRGRKMAVRSTHDHELAAVLRQLGYRLAPAPAARGGRCRADRETITQYLDRNEHWFADGDVLLIVAGRHYQVRERVGRRWVHVCSQYGPDSSKKNPRGRARVRIAYQVEHAAVREARG